MLTEIKQNFETEVLANKEPVVVDYWAPWCGPCKTMMAALEGLSTSYTNVKFCKVDVDENADLAAAYKISSLPTLIFYENGEEVRRITGMRPLATLTKFVNGEDFNP